jgi:GNAT superfamily N-acetyltransferase
MKNEPEVRVREILSARDPSFKTVMELYRRSFPPDEREPVWRIREWVHPLQLSAPNLKIARHLLVAERKGAPLGFSFFEFFCEVGIGFSVYLVVNPEERGKWLGQKLFKCSLERMQLDASFAGVPFYGCVLEVERIEDAVDEGDRVIRERRLRLFHYLGARIITPTYVQPALTSDLQPTPLNLMWLEQQPGMEPQKIVQQFYRIEFGLPSDHPFVQAALAGTG